MKYLRALERGKGTTSRRQLLKALGVTDRNSVAGLVRAHEAAKVTGPKRRKATPGRRNEVGDITSCRFRYTQVKKGKLEFQKIV